MRSPAAARRDASDGQHHKWQSSFPPIRMAKIRLVSSRKETTCDAHAAGPRVSAGSRVSNPRWDRTSGPGDSGRLGPAAVPQAKIGISNLRSRLHFRQGGHLHKTSWQATTILLHRLEPPIQAHMPCWQRMQRSLKSWSARSWTSRDEFQNGSRSRESHMIVPAQRHCCQCRAGLHYRSIILRKT